MIGGLVGSGIAFACFVVAVLVHLAGHEDWSMFMALVGLLSVWIAND